MNQLLQFVPAPAAQAPTVLATLHKTVDDAIAALSTFDTGQLETLQDQAATLNAEFLARELAEDHEGLPDLLRKQALFGEMLNATAANLRVVAAVLEARRGTPGTATTDRSTLISWPR